MIRLFLLIFTLFLLTNCSVKENLSIWNKKEENLENQKKIKKLFSKDKKTITEFNPELKLDISKLLFNENINDNQNNIGAQNYTGFNEKINTFKFSTIKDTNQLNYKPIFLDDGLIFFDNKGTIIRYDFNSKVIWKTNIYSTSEKKLNQKAITISISCFLGIDISARPSKFSYTDKFWKIDGSWGKYLIPNFDLLCRDSLEISRSLKITLP